MAKQRSQLRAGVALSYVNLLISTMIPFFYTPIVLKLLGQAEYGLYSLANSVIGYLSLLSFGFGNTITRYLSKFRAEEDLESERKTFGFFLLLYGGLSILVLIGGFFISKNTHLFFNQSLSAVEVGKLRTLTIIMAVNTALSFPHSVFLSILTAHERFIFRQSVDVVLTIATPIANLVALYMGFASVGMALMSLAAQIITTAIHAFYCLTILKVRPIFTMLPGKLIREICGFSLFVFLSTISDMLFWATDKVILGMLASTAAVAVYNIGGTFNTIVMSLSTSISGVLVPKITGMVVTNTPKSEWSDLMIRIGRLQFIIIGLIISGFTVFGRAFINMWAGPDYDDSFWVAVLTLFPLCVPLIQNTALNIVTAQNKHQFRSVMYFCIAVANAISTYLIVPYMGVIGAALCTCISYLLGQGLIMNIYYYKVTELDIPRFWGNILRMAVVPGTMLIAGLFLVNRYPLNNWMVFFAGVAVYTLIYAIVMYCFVMNNYEKDIIRKPIDKLIRRFR